MYRPLRQRSTALHAPRPRQRVPTTTRGFRHLTGFWRALVACTEPKTVDRAPLRVALTGQLCIMALTIVRLGR